MRKITCVAVKYDDDTVEVYHGHGNAQRTKTHNSPSRDLPPSGAEMINYLSLHLNITSMEGGYHTVIVQ